jgi:hypothetical protein
MATNSEDIMLGFGNLSAIDLKRNKTVFADVTGYVKRGGLPWRFLHRKDCAPQGTLVCLSSDSSVSADDYECGRA